VEGQRTPDGHVWVTRFSPMPKRLIPSQVQEFEQLPSVGFAPAVSKPYVTILVRFKDTAAIVPHPKSYYENLLISGDPGINPYYQETSYGAMNLNGSAVVDWITLPKNSSDYKVTGGIGVDDEAVIKDALAAADPQVDFSKFDGFNVVLNTSIGVIGGTGGRAWLTLDGVTKAWGRTYDNNQSSMFGLFAHEMGHTFGFDHSSGPYDTPYDSNYDQMSRGGTNHYDAKVGYMSQETNAYHRAAVGWIPDKRNLFVLPGADTTVRIERLSKPTSAGYLIARIPLGGSVTHYLTVECRQWVGNYDAKGALPHEGIVLHDVDTQRWVPDPFRTGQFGADRHSQVVDVDNNRDPNDDASIWIPGETYTDATNKVSVAVISAGDSYCNVRITSSTQVPPFNVVKNTADTGPSSLRNALLYGQMAPKTNIKFAMSPSDPGYANGVYKIQPISALPAITQAQTVVDATSQTAVSNSNPLGPEVYLDGSKASTWESGISISGTQAKILGFGIGNWQVGVDVLGASQSVISQCYVGTDATGVSASANRLSEFTCKMARRARWSQTACCRVTPSQGF
jgi:M6 family metalloprotease-like protein